LDKGVAALEKDEIQLRDKKEMELRGEPTQSRPVFLPAVDIYESKEALVLIADMPGVNTGGVEIHLEDGELTIRGRLEQEQIDAIPVYTEYRSGDYYRNFTLSNIIDQQKIEASMKDGVLRIIFPKAETARPRQITVDAG
jgi:HSP20 family protein